MQRDLWCVNRLLEWGQWFVKAVFCCNHAQTQPSEGKFFCQACGCGVIARWVQLRCEGCGCKRQSCYFLRKVVPQEARCRYCGEGATRMEYLEKPSYFHLHHALLYLEEEETYLTMQDFKAQAKAWLEPKPLLAKYLGRAVGSPGAPLPVS